MIIIKAFKKDFLKGEISMKKLLTFLPLGIGISAAIIYVFNVIQFRVINNSATLFQILSNLKIYLYISIGGFICYFLVKVLVILNERNRIIGIQSNNTEVNKTMIEDAYEPFENIVKEDSKESVNEVDKIDLYSSNYDDEKISFEDTMIIETPVTDKNSNDTISEIKEVNQVIINEDKYCFNCGEKISNYDRFCSCCGASQEREKKRVNPMFKNLINILEIVILLLIIYFSLNMLFDYKESKDPNFKSPFKVSMTK